MTWIGLTLVSAVLLGLYDIFKKYSVRDNAVIPVLFLSVCFSSAIWIIPTLLSGFGHITSGPLHVDFPDAVSHWQLFGKSALVGTSWILAYFALKHLPVSIVSPIRASGPLWTLIGAIFLLAERPTAIQSAGILITLVGFFTLSLVSLKDGIRFQRNPWIFAIIGATLLGAGSALYDRYLLGIQGLSVPTVQAWFSHYLVVFMSPFMMGWKWRIWQRGTFHWRTSIPLIAVALIAADYAYFMAMSREEALVAIISSLRRTAVVIPFLAGFILFKEKHFRAKVPSILLVLLGISCILLG